MLAAIFKTRGKRLKSFYLCFVGRITRAWFVPAAGRFVPVILSAAKDPFWCLGRALNERPYGGRRQAGVGAGSAVAHTVRRYGRETAGKLPALHSLIPDPFCGLIARATFTDP